jgi:hypothetical protein
MLENFDPSEIPELPADSMEDQALHQSFRPESDWVEQGIQDVPVDKIDLSESPVKSEMDFHKTSHDEMVRGFDTLKKEIRPALEKGADTDYFRNLDQQRGVDYAHGTQRVYEAFYGKDAIRIEKIGDHYTVINGYHRLFVAKELNVPNVPASVVEKRS